MKKRVMNLLIVLFLTFGILCSCSHLVRAEEEKIMPPTKAQEIPLTELKQAYVNLKKWQVKYYKEQLRSIALEYTGLCFKDKRYIKADQEIEKLNREIKQLLVQ